MQWYLLVGQQKLGPVSSSDVLAYLADSQIPETTLIWSEGMEDWTEALSLANRIKETTKPDDSRTTLNQLRWGSSTSASADSNQRSHGSAVSCVVLGALCLLIGIACLLDPSTSSVTLDGSKIANIQMLTIGETFSIMGAVFMAAGIRPRRA